MKLRFVLLSFVFLIPSFCFCSQTQRCQELLKNRLSHTDKRYCSFLLALGILETHGSKTLVETGTSRCGASNFIWDGGSTVIFSDWAHKHNAHLYSVDISPNAVQTSQDAVKAYEPAVTIVCSDSIEFLSKFGKPIDFLYLDSFDYEVGNPEPSQKHHLKEIEAAYPFLHANSIVMIDDCDFPCGGKGILVIDYLTKKGWNVLYEGYQVILTKRSTNER